MQRYLVLALICHCLACGNNLTYGQEATGEAATESSANVDRWAQQRSKIEAAIDSYVAAFNARDVAKLVSLWSPDGTYVSRSSGDEVVGRDAMTKEFTSIFAGEQVPNLAVQTESIEFISPNVALERGSATITSGDQIDETEYQAVYVNQDGEWLLDRVTEDAILVRPSNYERLKDLEFLIGQWVDDGGEISIELDCQWTANQNYISRTYRVTSADGVESSGLQIIGWDAAGEQIRSWLFDSDGGMVTGTWSSREGDWVVQSVATLADGAKGSFTSIFRPTEDGNYTWRKINRVLDGQLLPNIDEVLVVRK